MDRDDIIRLAKEAGAKDYGTGEEGVTALMIRDEAIERFAALVTTQNRPWVGLTDDEIDHAAEQSDNYAAFHGGIRFAEAKLKEKNGG